MSAKKTLRTIAAIAADEGCRVVEVDHGRGGHMKLRLLTPIGLRLLVVSIHEGDWRTWRNIRTDIRRLAREPLRRRP